MAKQRRSAAETRARILNPLELLNYVVLSAGDPRVQDEGLYRANRAQLLQKGILTHCRAFWLHEPGVPDELKPGADDDEEAEWTDEYGRYRESERQKGARQAWLAAHPVAA